MKVPFDVERKGDEIHYTYLDTTGRPVVVLNKKGLVEQHIQDFEVRLKLNIVSSNRIFVLPRK